MLPSAQDIQKCLAKGKADIRRIAGYASRCRGKISNERCAASLDVADLSGNNEYCITNLYTITSLCWPAYIGNNPYRRE